MSKMDALRAMREARYAETTARAAGRAASTRTTPAPVAPPLAKTTKRPAKKAASASTRESEPPAAGEVAEACGHRNMSGRACTRESGHAAKSHRYS